MPEPPIIPRTAFVMISAPVMGLFDYEIIDCKTCPPAVEKSNAGTRRGPRRLKSLKPFDKVPDAFFQRRVWAKADSALELGAVGGSFEDVAGLQRQVFADRRPANGLFDQAHQVHFHRLTGADIVKERGRLTGLALGLVCRIRSRCPRQKPAHDLGYVVDVGEIAAHAAVIKKFDRLTLQKRGGKQPHRHVGASPRPIYREKSASPSLQFRTARRSYTPSLVGLLGRAVKAYAMIGVI